MYLTWNVAEIDGACGRSWYTSKLLCSIYNFGSLTITNVTFSSDCFKEGIEEDCVIAGITRLLTNVFSMKLL